MGTSVFPDAHREHHMRTRHRHGRHSLGLYTSSKFELRLRFRSSHRSSWEQYFGWAECSCCFVYSTLGQQKWRHSEVLSRMCSASLLSQSCLRSEFLLPTQV